MVIAHKNGALPFVFVIFVGVVRLWCIVLPNLEVGWAFGFCGAQQFVQSIGSVAIVESLRKSLPLLQLESGVFEHQYLLPREIGICLHWPCVGYYMATQHVFLLVAIYTLLDVVRA